jgi:hypothetical protein
VGEGVAVGVLVAVGVGVRVGVSIGRGVFVGGASLVARAATNAAGGSTKSLAIAPAASRTMTTTLIIVYSLISRSDLFIWQPPVCVLSELGLCLLHYSLAGRF